MHERFILKVDHGRILTLCPIIDIYVGWKSWFVPESIVYSSQVVDGILYHSRYGAIFKVSMVSLVGWINKI